MRNVKTSVPDAVSQPDGSSPWGGNTRNMCVCVCVCGALCAALAAACVDAPRTLCLCVCVCVCAKGPQTFNRQPRRAGPFPLAQTVSQPVSGWLTRWRVSRPRRAATRTNWCVYIYIYIYINVYIYVCVCVYNYIYICVCECVYTHNYLLYH